MKRVLLLNQGKTQNIGDNAINLVFETFLQNKGFEVVQKNYWDEVEVFGKYYYKYPKLVRYILWRVEFIMDYFNKKSINRFYNNNKFDAVVVGGGELLSSHYGFNSSLYNWSILCKKNDIPIFLYGVSADVNMKTRKLNRYKNALSIASKIFVRDNTTKNLLNETYKINSIVYPDVVFGLRKVLNDKELTKSENKISSLVVPIQYGKFINFEDKISYIRYLYNEVNDIVSSNSTIIISSTEKSDEDFALELYDYFKSNSKENNIIFEKFDGLEKYIKIVKQSNKVFSGRMHAMIIGKIYGNEIYPYKFKQKLVTFENEYKYNNDIEKIENLAIKGLNELSKEINLKIDNIRGI